MTEHAEPAEAAATVEPVTLATSDCSVCRHPDAAEVDAALLAGTAIRTVGETFGLSRSSVHRHRQNHLSAETVTVEPVQERTGPLRLVDVHAQFAELLDRLEAVVALATRTRKAPAAVAAMREQRQTLEAIARIQADPALQRAAALEQLQAELDEHAARCHVRMIDFVLSAFGPGFEHVHTGGARQQQIVAGLMSDCLRAVSEHGVDARFGDVDTSEARAFVEQQAVERAARVEVEVQRRVEAELARRERQARPAIEARQVREIEGGPTWTA